MAHRSSGVYVTLRTKAQDLEKKTGMTMGHLLEALRDRPDIDWLAIQAEERRDDATWSKIAAHWKYHVIRAMLATAGLSIQNNGMMGCPHTPNRFCQGGDRKSAQFTGNKNEKREECFRSSTTSEAVDQQHLITLLDLRRAEVLLETQRVQANSMPERLRAEAERLRAEAELLKARAMLVTAERSKRSPPSPDDTTVDVELPTKRPRVDNNDSPSPTFQATSVM